VDATEQGYKPFPEIMIPLVVNVREIRLINKIIDKGIHEVLKEKHISIPYKVGIKYGICGEHGGDPRSIQFCHDLGLDYVSCSPFRVPVARIAAAQANVSEELAD
jgi:phosphoenolpyruvate synthase/pyruvate phosphate dikinase